MKELENMKWDTVGPSEVHKKEETFIYLQGNTYSTTEVSHTVHISTLKWTSNYKSFRGQVTILFTFGMIQSLLYTHRTVRYSQNVAVTRHICSSDFSESFFWRGNKCPPHRVHLLIGFWSRHKNNTLQGNTNHLHVLIDLKSNCVLVRC